MALVDLGNDTTAWEKEHESAQKLHFSLLGVLNERDHLPKNSQGYNKLSFQLRQSLSQLLGEIQSLKAHLHRLTESKRITAREAERRSLLVEDLLSKHRQLEDSVYNNSHSTASASRNNLIGTGAQGGPSQSSNSTSTNEHIPHRELRQIQVQVMEDQDRGLEELSKIIGRQRQMAQAIGDEVESQNDLIENITENVDRTRDRMIQQTSRIGQVDKRTQTCGYWLVIIALLVTIVIVASIPKK